MPSVQSAPIRRKAQIYLGSCTILNNLNDKFLVIQYLIHIAHIQNWTPEPVQGFHVTHSNCFAQVGTLEAQDLELTVETLRCRQDADKSSLVKKVRFLLLCMQTFTIIVIECIAQKDPTSIN
jgi:hypothetical protein